MKFGKILIGSCICAALISPIYYTNTQLFHNNHDIVIYSQFDEKCGQPYYYSPTTKTIKAKNDAQTSFSINDSALATKMMALLGKKDNNFTPNDLINHEDYKVNKEIIGSEGEGENITHIYSYSAKKIFLDLSYSNIKNINELCRFVWPQTLEGIDLSGNVIDNTNLEDILNFGKLASGDNISINEQTITVNADISEYVKIINLNLNNIDLSKVSTENLENAKVIYGFQQYSEEVFNKDTMPTQYYIKNENNIYFSAKKNNADINLVKEGVVTPLSYHGYGDYEINIVSFPDKPVANITKTLKTSYFNIYLKNSDEIKRKSYYLITQNDIVAEGLTEGFTIKIIKNPSTISIGKQSVNITFTTNTKSWTSSLYYTVIDLDKPTITLKGGETLYLTVNGRGYIEYGCTADDSGDDIRENLVITGIVDITTPGEYFIKYNLKDYAGNYANEVVRKVIVQEYALQGVLINSLNDEYTVNNEIILTSSLPSGVDISKYKHLSYTWYYNNQEFITTTGDKITGKSNVTIIEQDSKDINIYVVLTATLNDNSTESYVSDVMTLSIKKGQSDDPTIITALIIALVIVIIIMLTITIQKKKKSTHQKRSHSDNKTAKKKSTKSKNKKDAVKKNDSFSNYDQIQVIKDYNDNNNPPDQT